MLLIARRGTLSWISTMGCSVKDYKKQEEI